LRAEGRLDFSDPELIYIPKQMTREQLKAGFRELLNRVYDVEAYFDRVFEGAAGSADHRQFSARSTLKTRQPGFNERLLFSAAWAMRAVMLAFVMAGHGQLLRHLRVFPRVLRRNIALGTDAFGFGDIVSHWITYWHFASVTRQLRGTQFGNVPEVRRAREIMQS